MRTVKVDEYASRRKEILDVAQRLILTKGYDCMTIRDILLELRISKGALYHYFDSKSALLEALVEQMQTDAETPLLPIVQGSSLSASEKLNRFFAVLHDSRSAQKSFIASLARMWFADDNAIVREKVDRALLQRRTPLLTSIIQQGVSEGTFKARYPAQASEIVLSLSRDMGNRLAHLMLAAHGTNSADNANRIQEIVATYAAYADAIESVLGMPCAVLFRPDTSAVQAWLHIDSH